MAETLLAARRRAYTLRIRQIFADISRAHTLRFQHSLRYEFESRFESALEDAFQMGMREALKAQIVGHMETVDTNIEEPAREGQTAVRHPVQKMEPLP